MTNGDAAVAAFYDRWAAHYAQLAHRAPGVGRMRRIAVDELRLPTGGTVVDMGCGAGANFPALRGAVGHEGQIVGIDVSQPMLTRARSVDTGVDTVRGDARRPPIDGAIDGILATFVVTLFDDPAAVIEQWWSLLPPGGSLAVLNLAPMRGLAGTIGNPALELGLRVSTPEPDRYDRRLTSVLDERVTAAHEALDARADRLRYHDSADGLFRLAVGTTDSA